MQKRTLAGVIAVAATVVIASESAWAFDDAKYPDLSGAWERTGGAAPRSLRRPGMPRRSRLRPSRDDA